MDNNTYALADAYPDGTVYLGAATLWPAEEPLGELYAVNMASIWARPVVVLVDADMLKDFRRHWCARGRPMQPHWRV